MRGGPRLPVASLLSHPLLNLLLRVALGVMFCVAMLPVASPLLAAETAASEQTPQQRISEAGRTLTSIRRALEDAEAAETLATLAEKAGTAQRIAEAAVVALEPQLAQVDARIGQLGEVVDGVQEGREISQQRKVLAAERANVDSAIKQGKLLAEDARQLAESIEKSRAQQFNEQLSRKLASPLSPALWQQFATQAPHDYQRLLGLYQHVHGAFNKAVKNKGWAIPALGAGLALLLMFPLRLWLRRLGRAYAASERAPAGRLRRSGLAVWLMLVGSVLPGMAALALVESLRWIGAVPPRLEMVADTFVLATFIAAFIAALSACLLSPKRPSWRLVNLDDIAALSLRRYAWAAASLTWVTMLLRDINRASRTSEVTTVTLDGVIALAYVVLIMAMLATLSKLHRRRSLEAQQQLETQEESEQPTLSANKRSGWIVAGRVAGHATVLAALIATLFGYLNFALFTAQQTVWVGVVLLAVTLLLKFVDDMATWLFAADRGLGSTLRYSLGITGSTVEQVGVLSSALLRVLVVVVGFIAITAPFGNVNSVYGWLETLGNGLPIGDMVLRPGAVVRALVVLVVGLGLMRLLHHWLTETYLPKTGMEPGARNSISTVARYIGIILAVLWALAALGIGFEKLALLASALSVGIGFGLQAITQNFVSGLILLAERPVKIGDWVKIGDQEGDIRRINVRSTEIQVSDKSTLIVPNSELITKTIRNMTPGKAQGRIQIKFGVPLSTDVGLLRSAMLAVYTAHDAVLKDPESSVFIDSIDSGQIMINSFAYVSSPRNVYGVKSDLLFALLAKLHELDIPLATPTDIHLVTPAQEGVAGEVRP
jgi:potassium efflux system protein